MTEEEYMDEMVCVLKDDSDEKIWITRREAHKRADEMWEDYKRNEGYYDSPALDMYLAYARGMEIAKRLDDKDAAEKKCKEKEIEHGGDLVTSFVLGSGLGAMITVALIYILM